MMPRATDPTEFTGFADPKFFKELAKHQTREWFSANKAMYDMGFAKPMQLLLDELVQKLDRSFPDCELGAGKVFRIHRDVRFSKDKSPYKTHVAGMIPVRIGSGKITETPAAMYLQVGCDADGKPSHMAGAGLYLMDKVQLEKYRAAVLDAKKGGELAKLVSALVKKGASIEAGEVLKNPPRGVDPEHPRSELLKKKGLVAMYEGIPAATLKSRELVAQLAERGKAMAPLVRWLAWNTR